MASPIFQDQRQWRNGQPGAGNYIRRDARPRKNVAPSDEPTAADIAQETHLMQEPPTVAKRASKRPQPQAGQDLLASYMQQLGHLPLFTPAEEMQAAKVLEQAELTTWQLILHAPKAVLHLQKVAIQLDASLRQDIDALEQNYRRASARTHKKLLEQATGRDERIVELAQRLRRDDFDKEVLEQVVARMRREVWTRRVISPATAYRLTHADLTAIERSRGQALRTRNQFVRANLRLVIAVARHMHHFRIPFIDLIQEGNVGLMKAVHRFDHRRGFRFSTYAHWWIRQSIERAIINKGSQVRLPVHVIDARRQVHRARAHLEQASGRAPSTVEIAAYLGIVAEKVEQIVAGVQQDPVSLDESTNGADTRAFLELTCAEGAPALDESLIRENTHEQVRELLHLLNPIERDIIRRRFGLGADADETLDEIGRIYNLSRERVRQIQAQGLNKMRRMCERRQIH